MGTNFSGMEWAKPGLRFGSSPLPNVNFTVPRRADVAYLVASGFTKNRLPIQWELLQPMLHDTPANAAAVAAIGSPGVFHAGYESFITGVLDAHAAAGITCIIDCHNYCRYQDFIFQPDGSVIGLVAPSNPLVRAYTNDSSQVFVRIFSLAAGSRLKISNFNDFWTRAALKWKSHPGFGGYGLMNEPHDMPVAGGITGVYDAPPYSGQEDLTIWPTFAKAAISAIRAVDPINPIYLAGNAYGGAVTIGTHNPGWPLAGTNLIYEVHAYLDAYNNGAAYDYDTEVAKNFSAGFGVGSITLNTGYDRLKVAVDWAQPMASGWRWVKSGCRLMIPAGRNPSGVPPTLPASPIVKSTAGWAETIGRFAITPSTTCLAGTKTRRWSRLCPDSSRPLQAWPGRPCSTMVRAGRPMAPQ